MSLFKPKSLAGIWGDVYRTRRGDILPIIRVLSSSGRIMNIFPEHGRVLLNNLAELKKLLKAQQGEVESEEPEAEENPPTKNASKTKKKSRGK